MANNPTCVTHEYNCLGIISGSSLDGLDVAQVHFRIDPTQVNPILSWHLIKGHTYSFPEALISKLRYLPHGTALELIETDNLLGRFIGECAANMIGNQSLDFICSHGHTIFHHPGNSSTQIGNPALIASSCGLDTIGHIRNMDTAYGGEGAPLAPMADLLLFPDHEVCINLGGIANISIKEGLNIIGFDVCGANQFLNFLAQKNGQNYDDRGSMARSGTLDPTLLNQLNNIEYCMAPIPKSLDNEEVRSMYLPLLEANKASVVDQLRTMVEHIAIQLSKAISPRANSILITGGGAHNEFLVERLEAQVQNPIVVPDKLIVDFKEALLVAMCGALRLLNLTNCLKSITGATKNTINGVIYKA